MIQKSDILCKAEYATIESIESYSESPTGQATITATWLPIPIKVGTKTNFDYKTALSNQGTAHNSEINLSLASEFTLPKKVVLKLTFSSGTTLLIGSPSEQIMSVNNINTDNNIIQINHQSRNKPFKTA